MQPQGVGDKQGKLALIVVDHVHASAALLIPKFRAYLTDQFGTPFFACIPASDEAIAMHKTSREKIARYYQTAAETYANSAHPVSGELLLVEADSISVVVD